ADIEGGPAVARLIEQIGGADGILFVTPEYNYSIPGVLKNAIDWASRPAYQSVFTGKPAFCISVSAGALGGVRAQSHLKYILNGMMAQVFPWQEIVVPNAPKRIGNGTFADEDILSFAVQGVQAFIAHVAALKAAR
ncbi:MAG: NAD(P)H-dependent oxidoreductase, partial [Paracoccaceae bacterium]|nr:NAD(P)H-dependent oxidoreductase [Paracoccaceae bacterium]